MSKGIEASIVKLSQEMNSQKAINKVGRASVSPVVSHISNATWDIEGTMHVAQSQGSAYADIRISINGDGIIPFCAIEYTAEIGGIRIDDATFEKQAYDSSSYSDDLTYGAGLYLGGSKWLTAANIGVAKWTGDSGGDFGYILGFQGLGRRDGPREYQCRFEYNEFNFGNNWTPPTFKFKFRILSTAQVAASCRQVS